MRIFIAGASGAVGRPLVRQLAAAGHEVTGMTRTPEKAAALRELGAEPVVADALDREAVMAAVLAARPEVVVHQLTAIGPMNTRNLDAAFKTTNRLRTEGTDHLVAAARAAGARRFVGQSFAPWSYKREGSAGEGRGRPAGDGPAEARRGDARRDPAPRGRGDRRGGPRGDRAALRRLLRARAPGSPAAATCSRWSPRGASRSSATAAACGR